jgi:hypothetical protein
MHLNASRPPGGIAFLELGVALLGASILSVTAISVVLEYSESQLFIALRAPSLKDSRPSEVNSWEGLPLPSFVCLPLSLFLFTTLRR